MAATEQAGRMQTVGEGVSAKSYKGRTSLPQLC